MIVAIGPILPPPGTGQGGDLGSLGMALIYTLIVVGAFILGVISGKQKPTTRECCMWGRWDDVPAHPEPPSPGPEPEPPRPETTVTYHAPKVLEKAGTSSGF